jgi:hypothetical protein
MMIYRYLHLSSVANLDDLGLFCLYVCTQTSGLDFQIMLLRLVVCFWGTHQSKSERILSILEITSSLKTLIDLPWIGAILKKIVSFWFSQHD